MMILSSAPILPRTTTPTPTATPTATVTATPTAAATAIATATAVLLLLPLLLLLLLDCKAYQDNGGKRNLVLKLVNTAKSCAADQPHSSMPAAEASWKASAPEAVRRPQCVSIALFRLGAAFAYETPCHR